MSTLAELNTAVQDAPGANASVKAWIAAATPLIQQPPANPYPFWARDSYLFQPIDWATAKVAPNSAAQIAALAAASPHGIVPNGAGNDYGGTVICDARDATTTMQLTQTRGATSQGQVTPMPWNPAWPAGVGVDNQIAVYNPETGYYIEVEAFDAETSSCHAWCLGNITTDQGYAYPDGVADGALLAGIVLPQEYAAGVITHRLRLAIQTECGPPIGPYSLRNDENFSPNGIQAGATVALPPSVSLAGLDEYQTVAAKAYQVYGATVLDASEGTAQACQAGVPYPVTINGLPQSLLAQFVVLA